MRRRTIGDVRVESSTAAGAAGDVVLEVGGEIDVYTAPKLRDRITELVADGVYHLVIDMEAVEFLDSTGLGVLVGGLKKVRAHLNPGLEIEGLLRTMYDPRNTLALNVAAELEKHFGEKVYRTVIPRNVRLAEAPSHGLPAIAYDRRSSGAEAYWKVAMELVERS